jgi:hypothetical protein
MILETVNLASCRQNSGSEWLDPFIATEKVPAVFIRI